MEVKFLEINLKFFIIYNLIIESIFALGFLTSTALRLLARLSFQVYLWQFPMLIYATYFWNDRIYLSVFLLVNK